MQVGIEAIGMYTSNYFIDLRTLAAHRNEDPNKYYVGIGQEKMAAPPPDEDIVTLAANAAREALTDVDASAIDTLLFATESGIDQSKAAGTWLHRLLDLPKNMRVIELKQACYSGAGGLMLTLPYLMQHPERKILLVAADIARYGLDSAGEPTQGAGAAALVLSAQPRLLAFDSESGLYTEDVFDFWRPNYRDEAFVDGKYSVKIYLRALAAAWNQYCHLTGRGYHDFDRFVYHLPFSKMGEKAQAFLVKHAGLGDLAEEEWKDKIQDAAVYQRIIGNTYAASVFVALISLLECSPIDLTGRRVGLFSYGSGCVGEFFSGVVLPGYQQYLKAEAHRRLIEERQELDYAAYSDFYTYKSNLPTDGTPVVTPKYRTGGFRFAGIQEHKRLYEVVN